MRCIARQGGWGGKGGAGAPQNQLVPSSMSFFPTRSYLARASASLCCSAITSELSDKLTFMWLSCRCTPACCCCFCCCCCCWNWFCRRCCWLCRACVSRWSAARRSSRRVRATAAASSSLPAPVAQPTPCQTPGKPWWLPVNPLLALL